jgi:diguanylate cyclase (GGDEF)-like protein
VLEALGEQTAVLDPQGVIVRVNAAWQRTPPAHRNAIPRSEVGTDYPAALRALTHSRAARIAAEGVMSVLRGALPAFQSDYDEQEWAYSLQVDPLPHGGAVVRHVDISFRKHLQRQLAHRATHDDLTGLPNRVVMMDRLGQALVRAASSEDDVCLLFCDVDRFKQINDAHGHGVGDQVLVAVARRLQHAVRQSDLVARFGGDEFVVLLDHIASEPAATQRAAELQAAAMRPIVVDGRPLHFGVSLGAAMHPGSRQADPATVASFVADADAAMYVAKQTGGSSIHMFEPADRYAQRDPARIAPALRKAAANDEIRMMAQPIVELQSGRVTGFEALVRWELPEVGMLSPADFLQTAEETAAIIDIGRSILRQSLNLARQAPEQTVSMNVSWVELAQVDYADGFIAAVRASGVAADRLAVEITVPATVQSDALRQLRELRRAGVGITLDAFGRQPVELSLLPQLSATAVKIDRRLTGFATQPGRMAPMLHAIVGLISTLGLDGIAEGVESAAQAQAAEDVGLRFGQGYYFGKPVEPAEALRDSAGRPDVANGRQ